jgi:hypothetical protein
MEILNSSSASIYWYSLLWAETPCARVVYRRKPRKWVPFHIRDFAVEYRKRKLRAVKRPRSWLLWQTQELKVHWGKWKQPFRPKSGGVWTPSHPCTVNGVQAILIWYAQAGQHNLQADYLKMETCWEGWSDLRSSQSEIAVAGFEYWKEHLFPYVTLNPTIIKAQTEEDREDVAEEKGRQGEADTQREEKMKGGKKGEKRGKGKKE